MAAAILPDIEPAESRITFRQFVSTVNPRYQWYRHCEIIANVAQRVADGELSRVMLFVPPRHSKSETISRLFSAYYLRRHPDKWVGINSYSAELAYTLSRSARDFYVRDGGMVRGDAGAVKHWETGQGGGLWAAGVGGPITGKGFHLGIIDDPIKNAEEATSETIRRKHQDWYSSTFYTRAEPGAGIVIIQCMTGDTPVLMADCTERPLREVKIGDQVATYDNGQLRASTVKNHTSNGHDFTYKIMTISGRIVYANERHPFLVEEHGELKWLRLKSLTTAHTIVTVKDRKGSGRERFAPLKAVTGPLAAEDIAHHTIIRKSGLMDIDLRHLIRYLIETHTLSTDTELLLMNIMQCWPGRMENAPFVNSPRGRTCERIGTESCALITAMTPIQSEDCYAMTAISPWDMLNQKQPHSLWLNTSDFTVERIASIEPAGIQEVFDIQIEHTENFIANGMVSHNTRWHEEDLAGWLLSEESGENVERWHIVNLPAFADDTPRFPASCTIEQDKRQQGEALCEERYDAEQLHKIRRRIGEYFFDALYQQRPTAKEGDFFKVSKIETVPAMPAGLRLCRGWDLAASAGSGAYTSGALLGVDPAGVWYVCDVARGQWSPDDVHRQLRSVATQDGESVKIHLPQDPGQAGKDQALQLVRMLAGFQVKAEPVSGSKESRAFNFAAQVNAGNVRLLKGEWNRAFIEELRQFPRGKYKDQVDSASDAFTELATTRDFQQGTYRI